MRSIGLHGTLASVALLAAACSGDAVPDGDLGAGRQAVQRPSPNAVARLTPAVTAGRPVPAGMLSPIGAFEGSYDAATNQMSIHAVDPGRTRSQAFGLLPVAALQIATVGAVNSSSSTTGVPYVGLGGATRTCRMPSASVCTGPSGGAANLPCMLSTCGSITLADITGKTWSEVWVQIKNLSKGTVISGDNRGLLTPTDWRVAMGGMDDAATSLGAFRYGVIPKQTTPATPVEVDWEFDLGPGTSNFTFQAFAWGTQAATGYTMSATSSCSPEIVPSSGTVPIFPYLGSEGPHAVSVTGGLPFPFTLYGVTDTALWASFDGAFGLGATPLPPDGPYGPLPTSTTTQGLILPQWAHTQGRTLAPDGSVVGFPSPAASPTAYVISATGIRWADLGGALLDYQVVLDASGSVRFLYPGGTNVTGSVDHGSQSISTSTATAAQVLLGAPVSASSPNLGATIGLQGALTGTAAPFAQYGSGGAVTGTGAGVAQQCAGAPCVPTLLPGALTGAGTCFAIDFTPTY